MKLNHPPPAIDGFLYPDIVPPETLTDLADRVDFLARLCGAWDFGHLPDSPMITEVRQSNWREAVDQCRFLTSPSYHLLRQWHRLPFLPFLGQKDPVIDNDPNLEFV